MILARYQETKESIVIALVSILILFVFPLGAVIVGFAILITTNNRKSLLLFALLTALYISFINISKPVMSDPDLPWYAEQYKMVEKMDFSKYIYWFGMNGKGRELFFPTYNYVVHFVAGNNFNLYRFILSLTCYLLSFYSIIRMGENMRMSYWKISIPIIWFSCFPWIFTYNQTILRQFLAGSILMYIIIERFLYQKKAVIPTICMVLTHTSTFFFIPFLYISVFRKPFKLHTAALFSLVLTVFFFIQAISGYLFSFMGASDNALSYALRRASVNTTFILPHLGIGKVLFMITLSVICVYLFYFLSTKKQIFIKKRHNHFAIINTYVIFCAFIMANTEQLELSNRLFTYATMLSAFPLFYIIKYYRPTKLDALFFFCIMNVILTLYFTHSIYTYDIPYGLLIHPMQFLY